MERLKANRPRDKTARMKPLEGAESEFAVGEAEPEITHGADRDHSRSNTESQRTPQSRSVPQRDSVRDLENIRDKAAKKRRQSLTLQMLQVGLRQNQSPTEERESDFTVNKSGATDYDASDTFFQTAPNVQFNAPKETSASSIIQKPLKRKNVAFSGAADTTPRFTELSGGGAVRSGRPFKTVSRQLSGNDHISPLCFKKYGAGGNNGATSSETMERKTRGTAYVRRFNEPAAKIREISIKTELSHDSSSVPGRILNIPQPASSEQSGCSPDDYFQKIPTENVLSVSDHSGAPEHIDRQEEQSRPYFHERALAPVSERRSSPLHESVSLLRFHRSSETAPLSAEQKSPPSVWQDVQAPDSYNEDSIPEQVPESRAADRHEPIIPDANIRTEKPQPSDKPRSKAKKPSKLLFNGGSKKTELAQHNQIWSKTEQHKSAEKPIQQDNAELIKTPEPKNGNVRTGLRFESEFKSPNNYLKGSPISNSVKFAANTAAVQAHRMVNREESENVGVQAAHKTEELAERGLRAAYRLHKTTAYKKAAGLGGKTVKLKAKASYRMPTADNPELKSGQLSRIAQKRRIKQQYAKSALEARKTAASVKNAGSIAHKAARLVIQSVSKHPAVFGTIAALGFLLIIIMSALSSCSNIAGGIGSAVTAASYLAEDADVDGAELYYTELETDLKQKIICAESDYPGYDEYRRNIGDISHNPYELMAYLTARYRNFTLAGIEPELQSLFDGQYQLSFAASRETRYDDEGEPYEWRVMTVTLSARSFYDVSHSRLSDEQRRIYALLMQTRGSRQYANNPFDFGWLSFVTDSYGWRISPITGKRQYHKGVDISVPAGTPILAAHDGVITTGYDSGGYGYYISLDNGAGLVTKYAHCNELIAADGAFVLKGDVIAKSGNTGSSARPHLHFEVIKNGEYINPLYFASTGDSGSGPIYGTPGLPMGDGSYAALIEEAEQFLGMPYVFGGSSPSTSFDCSGFVCWVLNRSGTASVRRTTAQGLYNLSTPIPDDEAQPGDLLFLTGTYSSVNPVTHVAVYAGNNMVIHAGDPIQYSMIDTSWWRSHHYSFARVNATENLD